MLRNVAISLVLIMSAGESFGSVRKSIGSPKY